MGERGEGQGGGREGHRSCIQNNLSLLHVHDALPAFPKQDLQIVPLDYINQAMLKSDPTDAYGEVVVAIRNDGLNVLAVDHSVPLENDPKADKIGYMATLGFVAEAHCHDD